MLSNNKQLLIFAVIIITLGGIISFFNSNRTSLSPQNSTLNQTQPNLSNDYIKIINENKNQTPSEQNISNSPTSDVSRFDFPSVAYASDLKNNTAVYNSKGEKVETAINASANGTGSSIQVTRPQQFVPGRYSLVINQNGRKITQDFLWGVLAVNTNKSVYAPGETANLAIAVLNESGNMVCDAKVTLEIKDPTGKITTLSVQNGSIKVNPECKQKKYTVNPDYESKYQVGPTGTYQMSLTAVTANGNYNIVDFFSVENQVDFDVERITATRIFPYSTYPVNIKVTARKDFSGQIAELAPTSFDISPLPGTISYASVQQNKNTQYIVWNVSIKKGQTINIGYNFKAPLKAPDFYLLGPLNFIVGSSVIFQERRTWQLAIDATYQSVILATSGLIGYWRLGEPSGTNADDISTANHDGTYVNSPTLGVAGALTGDSDTAVTFNGTTQDMTMASVADFSPGSVTGPVSFELWFKRSTGTNDNGLVERPGAAAGRWFLYVSGGFSCTPTPNGTIVWGGGSTAVTCGTSQVTTTTSWHYLVVTYDGTASGWIIYLDGANDGAAVHTDGTVPTSNTGTITLAQDLASDFWHGSIDEFAIYNVALSQATVTEHYNAGQGIFAGTTGDTLFKGVQLKGIQVH